MFAADKLFWIKGSNWKPEWLQSEALTGGTTFFGAVSDLKLSKKTSASANPPFWSL